MASVDSGVETGNESNDGPLDGTNEMSLVESESPSSLPQLHPLNGFEMTSCQLSPPSLHLKLPESPLPFGLWGNLPKRPNLLRLRKEKKYSFRGLGTKALHRIGLECQDERKLRVAVSSNNIELVQSFLFSGVSPNCIDSMGRSPLHLAACSGYADIVRLLLENGANPNQRDRLGNTPLHLAACTNNVVVVTLLLKAGTDVCSSDLRGRSPLQLAQSKLKLLQEHMAREGTVTIYVKQEGSRLAAQNKNIFSDIPVYDNSFVANQAQQIVEMITLFLQKRGQESEAELLSTFSSRLSLSETKEQVGIQVKDLLNSLSDLSLAGDGQTNNHSSGSSGSNCTTNNSLILYSSGKPLTSFPSPSFSTSSSNPGIFHRVQAGSDKRIFSRFLAEPSLSGRRRRSNLDTGCFLKRLNSYHRPL
ncbi:Ankyrin repeat domain-containing protein 54 [Frankliniella fusca]|uniref:Ankyrin repeat domain-containing protein 54 n=1 Tax=Frankliniella fusca TaxID=407009 RepID=A0AAE1GY02_9NEOP|nr:Ankyrin repeat domain-containing protein 54 [Frankliniella fusca]KAK3929879.1 Ankyrin repeat domain-containing protein 54 [Frankliniella fusca]